MKFVSTYAVGIYEKRKDYGHVVSNSIKIPIR